MRTEGFRGVLLSILVIALIASTMSLLSLSLAFAEPGQSPPLGGGNLVIVQSVDADTLDVHRTRFDWAYQVIALVHDTLMTFDYEMKYIPLLAESWEVDPNGLYIDYHLRGDVKFHCGEPFNADAVVYTIRRAKEPWSAHVDSVKNVLDTEKLDEYTVRIHLKQWDRWLYDWFATTSSSIVCPRCAEEHGLDYGEKYFCGTGPFKVKEWIRDDRLILERNEDYRWGPEIYQNRGPAHLEGITFEVIPSDISREEKFKRGEADMMVGISPRPPLIDWLNTTEGVVFIKNPRSSMLYVGFHVGTLSPEIQQGIVSGRPYPPGAIRSPVSDDPEGKGLLVRKALLYATHRGNLVLHAWENMGKVAYGPLTSVIWGYNPAMEDMYPYDPEMARSLLAQADYAEGLELTIITTNYEPYTKTAQVLKEQWADVGVTLNIEVRAFGDIEEIIANAQHDLWVGGWTWHNADMIRWYWHTSRVPPASNRFWWGSAYTDAVIENTNAIDDDVAYYAIQESQRLIMEDAAYLPVVERPFLLAHWDRIKGFEMHPLSNFIWKHLDTYIVPSHGPIVSGKDTAYNTNLEGDSPLKEYTSSPLLMAAARVGSGAVVATGTVSTTRDTRWNDINNPAPNFDVLLDKAFEWMTSGKKVLWFEGYGVYNTIDAPEVQCQQLEDALEAKGYTLTGDTTTPITSGLLSGYDILVIPQLQLGEIGTGGNPALLPDADVQAIKTWVEGGGGLLIMDSSDYGGRNYSKVHNKILEALGVGFYFQDDQVQDDTNQWGQAAYQPIAVVDTTTDIGSAYQSATGTNEIGLYSLCSLRIEKDYEVSVMVSPTINVGEAGEVLIYEATITNIGTKSDTYTLTVEDELWWPITLSKNEVSLEPGESEVVEVEVTVPEGLTEKMANWITLTASGVSEDDARFRAVNIFPLEEPPYDVVRPDMIRFLGPGLPTLLVDLPAVPVITAIETGFSVDLTPREPWPLLYGKGEFAPVGAAELIDNGRVTALPNSILRDAYFDRPELANDEVMSLTVRWMIDWEDPREHSLLYYVTEDAYHLPPGTTAPIVTKYIEMLEEGFGFEVGTQVGGEITPGLIAGYDVLQLAELMRPLSLVEVQAVVDYVNDGGGLIIMCQGDYGGIGRPRYPNELLEALNSGIRFQDDELYDEDSWVVDGPWYPQVYLLDPREVNPEFDVWFPEYDFTIYMPVRSMTLESARAFFTTILKNEGTADTTYTIEVTETTTPEKLGWDIEVIPTEIDVAAGENVEIYAIVTVPDIEAGRKRMDLNIKVTDAVQDYLTKSNRFAVLAQDGRAPPEAKFKVGQSVSHADWGEVTIEKAAWGGQDWVYVVKTADGKLKLAAEGDLSFWKAIPAIINIHPETLNLRSGGKWITCRIELQDGYSVGNIDVSTVRLIVGNDNILAEPKPMGIGGRKLMVKFSRPAVQAIVSIGEVELTVTGLVDSTPFEGSDTIMVIKPGKVDLEARLMEIPFYWSMVPPAERLDIETEFMEIPFYWSGAPD